MIPKIIHQIHLGEPADAETQRMMRTVRELNPDWVYTLWTEQEFGKSVIANLLDSLGSWASVSNYLRLMVLAAYGGVYLDTDVECLKPMDRFLPYEAFAALQDTDRICNAIMGAVPGHSWVQYQRDNFNTFDQRDAASGVYLASAAPRAGLTLVDPRLVYPYSYDTPPFERRVFPETVLVHKWNASWIKNSTS